MRELNWQADDGVGIASSYWEVSSAKQIVVLVHGWGDHHRRFDHVVEFLNSHHCSVFASDMRGHGRSEGKRGYVRNFQILRDDFDRSIEQCRAIKSDLPILFYGHSFGGTIVLDSLLRNELTDKPLGAIVTGPLLKLTMDVPEWKIWLGKSLGRLVPRMTVKAGLDPTRLSRDKLITEKIIRDPYRHGRISAQIFFDMMRIGDEVIKKSRQLPCPVLLMHAEDDRVTSFSASQTLAEIAGENVEFHAFPNMYHEIHNEIDNDQVFQVIADWLKRVI